MRPEDKPDADGYWPLYPGSVPCVGSGLCCKKARCTIGTMKHGPGADCPSLREKDGRHWCGEVVEASPERAAALRAHLYVGAGCCMPMFNEARERIIKLGKGGK